MFCRSIGFVSLLIASAAAPAQAQDHAQRKLWANIRAQLLSRNGDAYFEQNIKDSQLPALSGRITSFTINKGLSKFVLAVATPDVPEVTLIVHHLDWVVSPPPKPGATVQFTGVGSGFTREPFMLTFDVGRTDIEGLQFQRAPRQK